MDRTGDKVSRPGPQFPERPTQDGSRPSQPNADSQQDGGTCPPPPNGSRPTCSLFKKDLLMYAYIYQWAM